MGLPLRHLLSSPTHYGIFENGKRLIWHHHVLVDADDTTIALTGGARTVGVVEAEEIGVGFLKSDAVGLETVGERLRTDSTLLRILGMDAAGASAFKKSRLHRLGDARQLVVVAWLHLHAVHQQHRLPFLTRSGEIVFDADDGTLDRNAHETFLMQHLQLWAERMLGIIVEWSINHDAGLSGEGIDMVDHVADRMAFHLNARDG